MDIFGLSEQNRQPEPPARKPNEDSFGYFYGSNIVCAAVMDGIPVPRNESGEYPAENGSVAARVAVMEITAFRSEFHVGLFEAANKRIGGINKDLGIYKEKEPLWLATVGCVLQSDLRTQVAHFGYIGDPLAFLISSKGEIKLLTEDQLRPFESHLSECHPDKLKDPGAMAMVREYQDKYIRNHLGCKCFCDTPLRGWGALTGEEIAMSFVEMMTIEVSPGTRVILSSDAIEAIGAGNFKKRKAEDYRSILLSLSELSTRETAERLLELTRRMEVEKGAKSDDATFVVIDF